MRQPGAPETPIDRPAPEGVVHRIARHLRAAFPAQMAAHDDAVLAAAIEASVQKARAAGFANEIEITSVVEYVLAFGLDLEGEAARAVLGEVGLSRMGKLRKLGAIALRRASHG